VIGGEVAIVLEKEASARSDWQLSVKV